MTYFYEPQEDSELMLRNIKTYAKGDVLEIGCGSGILAAEAAQYAKNVVAVDINPDAVAETKRLAESRKLENISTFVSDFFANVKGTFDLIICNPPYLPEDENEEKDMETKALAGGKHGYEFVERFLSEAEKYLKDDGRILLLFSSLTKKMKVDGFVEQYCFEKEEVDIENMFFETLYVYEIKKSYWFGFFKDRKIKEITLFAKGKRGEIYTGVLGKKKIAMKVKRKESLAVGRIENEARFLKLLNKKNIGPKLISHGDGFVVYVFVEGVFLPQFVKECKDKKTIKELYLQVLDQMFVLDSLGIVKEEMHHPHKHIIVTKKKKAVLLDFERCKYSKKPKNVTQFIQYMYHPMEGGVLKEKGIILSDWQSIQQLLKRYKLELNQKKFLALRKAVFC